MPWQTVFWFSGLWNSRQKEEQFWGNSYLSICQVPVETSCTKVMDCGNLCRNIQFELMHIYSHQCGMLRQYVCSTFMRPDITSLLWAWVVVWWVIWPSTWEYIYHIQYVFGRLISHWFVMHRVSFCYHLKCHWNHPKASHSLSKNVSSLGTDLNFQFP